MWMQWVAAQEGFKRHQITEHKDYEGKVKLKHRKVRFIQISASPCAQVFRYHPNRDWLSHQWSIPDINKTLRVSKTTKGDPLRRMSHPASKRQMRWNHLHVRRSNTDP
jgi:hypothetical protein